MTRDIQIKFNPNDELILMVDKAKKKLNTNASALARFALFEYCKKILEDGRRN